MATIIYKKYFKKQPIQSEQSTQRQTVNNISDGQIELTSAPRQSLEGRTTEEARFQNVDKQLSFGDNTTSPTTHKEDGRAMRRYRWKLMIGLFLPFFVQSLDVTIISGALPFIASDFHELAQLNWIVSAFNLTSATFIPVWGQFADIFGRYAAIQCALISMVLGSVICAASPVFAFPMLLVGRGFQGMGCSGLLILTKVVLADKVSLKENARNNTIFTIVGGIGYGVGPIIGGYLTQVSWRWCFIINIPLGLLGLVLAHFVLRSELLGPQEITRTDGRTDLELPQTFAARIATIDFGGQFLFLFGMGLFVLALTWAGSYYAWDDVKVLAPLIIGVILIIIFLAWEYFMLPGHILATRWPTRHAMIPLKLLTTRNAGLLIYINFVTGMALYAVFYFVDLYFALVKGYAAGKAGINLLYYMPGLGGGAYLAMFACNVWPRQTFFPLMLGTILEPLGITILAVAISSDNSNLIYGMLSLTGVGTGIRFMPGTLHGVGYFPTQIAPIISLMSLAVALGGTFATTIMLNIFNNSLSRSGLHFNSASSSSFGAITALPQDQQNYFRDQASRGIVLAFFAITAFMWLGVLACSALGNVRIAKTGSGKSGDMLTKGSFIGSLIWNRGAEEEKVEQNAVVGPAV